MAANDFYYGSSSANKPSATTPSNQYFSPYQPSLAGTAPPAYTSRPPTINDHDRPSHANNTVSPFESVFDDHVYPLEQRQSASSSQHHAYPSTAYNGAHGRVPSDDRPYSNEAIPLQNRPAKGTESPDHVYDAAAANAQQPTPKRGLLRLGELGMLGSSKKRIPWVVYLLTVIQIAVFIGEIIKNGMSKEQASTPRRQARMSGV